jgi:spermidine/putrescine-binding protein
MLDEVREVVGAALIAAGHDPNDVSDRAVSSARYLLARQRRRVARYDSDDFTGPVVTGEVVVHQAWSGPASHAVAANPHLRYVVPSDGAIMWVTSAAIPADAPEPELSREFLTELMDPELAATTTLANGYATPNEAARRLLPEGMRERKALFPDDETLTRCIRLHDIGAGETLLAVAMPRPSG